MPLEPTHDELVEMQQTHDALERSSELQQRVLADPKGPEELLRRLMASRGQPGASELSRLIWQEGRYWAAATLSKMDRREAVPMLLRALESDDHWSVEAAMKYLGALKHPSAIQPLATRLGHPQVGVRRAAVLALGKIATPEAVRALKEALEDPDVGGSAALSLLEIGTPEAIQSVIDAISDPAQGSHLRQDAFVIVSSAHRFCRRPAPDFVDALRTLLSNRRLDHRAEVTKALSLIEEVGASAQAQAPPSSQSDAPEPEKAAQKTSSPGRTVPSREGRILTWIRALVDRLRA